VWGDPGASQTPPDAGAPLQPRSPPRSGSSAAGGGGCAWGGAAQAVPAGRRAGAGLRVDEFPSLGGEGEFSSSLGSDGWHERSPWDPPALGAAHARTNGPAHAAFDARGSFGSPPRGAPPAPPARNAAGGWGPPAGERWGSSAAHDPGFGGAPGERFSAGCAVFGRLFGTAGASGLKIGALHASLHPDISCSCFGLNSAPC